MLQRMMLRWLSEHRHRGLATRIRCRKRPSEWSVLLAVALKEMREDCLLAACSIDEAVVAPQSPVERVWT